MCNAHHLRKLQAVLEQDNQWRAFHLSVFLVSVYGKVKSLKAQGKIALLSETLATLTAQYDAILDQGFEHNPMPPNPLKPKKRGCLKRSAARNLLGRSYSSKTNLRNYVIYKRLMNNV